MSAITSAIGVPTTRITTGTLQISRTRPSESIRTVFQTGAAEIAAMSVAGLAIAMKPGRDDYLVPHDSSVSGVSIRG